jgi:hypothetical protein
MIGRGKPRQRFGRIFDPKGLAKVPKPDEAEGNLASAEMPPIADPGWSARLEAAM